MLSSAAGLYRLRGLIPGLLQIPRVQILYLHHVFEDEESSFRSLLRSLASIHTFISYSEAVDRIHRGSIDRPYLAFSFDDGLKNCLRSADILEEFGAKACYFVCTELLEEKDSGKIAHFCRARLNLPPTRMLSWEDAEKLAARGHEIGSHTVSHAHLASSNHEELREEIEGSFQALNKRLGRPKHFAWPYGRLQDFSREALRTVQRAGFESCASAERGCHISTGAAQAFQLFRDHIIAGWPLDHSLFLLARTAKSAARSERCSGAPLRQ